MAKTGFHQSSLTKKYIMALAGLFLIIFLFVHLAINLLVLLKGSENYEARELFNIAAHFMGTNIFIKVFEVVLFGGFLIHILYGLVLQIQNWMARPERYKKENYSFTSPFSKFMIHTGILVLIFLVIHLNDFYIIAKFTDTLQKVNYHGEMYPDLGLLVIEKFHIPWYVTFNIVMFLLLGFHLHHAFQSGFQSMGWQHSKYSPTVRTLSLIVSVFLTIGFITIPLVIYFGNY